MRQRFSRILLASALALGTALSTGCIYTNVVMPLDTNLQETNLGTRVGRAEAQSVLFLFAWGDAGTQAAARDGGITTITHADLELFSVFLFFYTRQRTIVYGD